MNAREKINQEILKYGFKGDIPVTLNDELYTTITASIQSFYDVIEKEADSNLHTQVPVLIHDEAFGFSMKFVAGSTYLKDIGPIILFSFKNFVNVMNSENIKSVSKDFVKRFMFGCLAHEYYHCRENGKYLSNAPVIEDHDADPEEIKADEYAFTFLNKYII